MKKTIAVFISIIVLSFPVTSTLSLANSSMGSGNSSSRTTGQTPKISSQIGAMKTGGMSNIGTAMKKMPKMKRMWNNNVGVNFIGSGGFSANGMGAGMNGNSSLEKILNIASMGKMNGMGVNNSMEKMSGIGRMSAGFMTPGSMKLSYMKKMSNEDMEEEMAQEMKKKMAEEMDKKMKEKMKKKMVKKMKTMEDDEMPDVQMNSNSMGNNGAPMEEDPPEGDPENPPDEM